MQLSNLNTFQSKTVQNYMHRNRNPSGFYVGPRLLRCPPLSYGRETGGEEG